MHAEDRDCGGLMIGVDSMEPNTPPLLIVNVPPVSSSTSACPSLRALAESAICFSMSAIDIWSASRRIGTTRPRGLPTAMPMSK
jgi:hypothetical protein